MKKTVKKTKKVAPKDKLKTQKELLRMTVADRQKYLYENQKRYPVKDSLMVINALFGRAVYGDEKENKELADSLNENHFREEKRQVWEANHTMIMNEINRSLKNGGGFPTVSNIANDTTLSRTTVYKHLESFDKSVYNDIQRQKLRISIDRVLIALYNIGLNHSDTKCMDMYLKYALKILETDKPAPPQNTFIQVNNIYVNQQTFASLAPAKREQIEQILLSENISDNQTKSE